MGKEKAHSSVGRRPLLSLCMIVKDGGASLTRCLESARGVVDEIVVVDTGSGDDSVARAKSAGARVLHHVWSDDFAAARNVGLDAAHGEWILLLDCDERFDPPSPRQLRGLLERSDHVAYFLNVHSELARGERLESTILRLWRHSPEVRFRFPIHEQVVPDLERVAARTGRRFALVNDVRIVHDGYTPDAIAAHGKVERNSRLFAKAVAQHEGEPYLWYKFADFLRAHPERRSDALAAAERAFELVKRNGAPVPYWSELLTILCASRLEAGDRPGALALLESEPPSRLESPHYRYVAALALEAEGRIDEALAQVEACCATKRSTHLTAWRPEIAGAQGETLRARLLLKRGDARGAIAATRRALELAPAMVAAIQLQADALVASDAAGDALRLLMDAVKRAPRERRLWQQVALLLARLGRPVEAQRCVDAAERCAS
jgi:hypothetical protein